MRTTEEITSQILRSALNGATQMTLMYETYLSHDTITAHLKALIEQGLLRYISTESRYKTTPRGKELLAQRGEALASCSHQCKKCGMLYQCGAQRCANAFHHGMCLSCGRLFALTTPVYSGGIRAPAETA